MKKRFSSDIIKIFSKAAEEKIYGSVEVYFEAGNITQITQRIINKVYNSSKTQITSQTINRPKKIEEQRQKDSQPQSEKSSMPIKFTT